MFILAAPAPLFLKSVTYWRKTKSGGWRGGNINVVWAQIWFYVNFLCRYELVHKLKSALHSQQVLTSSLFPSSFKYWKFSGSGWKAFHLYMEISWHSPSGKGGDDERFYSIFLFPFLEKNITTSVGQCPKCCCVLQWVLEMCFLKISEVGVFLQCHSNPGLKNFFPWVFGFMLGSLFGFFSSPPALLKAWSPN